MDGARLDLISGRQGFHDVSYSGAGSSSRANTWDFDDIMRESSQKAQKEPSLASVEKPITTSQGLEEYRVRSGDTLSEIVANKLRNSGISHNRARIYNLVQGVSKDNNLTNPDRIFPGQRLNTSRVHQAIQAGNTATEVASTQAISSPERGAAATAPASPSGVLQAPASGRITSEFGYRQHPILGNRQHHDGVDIAMSVGNPIKPVAPGTVVFAGNNGGYGLMVDVDHGDGMKSRYAHLDNIHVQVGDEVGSDSQIGNSGNTGLVRGPHLHLEIHQDDRPINPLSLISRSDIEGQPVFAAENGEYTVRRGDTMSEIVARELDRRGVRYTARELFDTVKEIATANGLSNPDRIYAGQNLDLSRLEAKAGDMRAESRG